MANRNIDPSSIRSVLATDCGSTTTKAILIERVDGEYRQTVRGEAPTTVEAPFEDVTRGVLNAIKELEELAGRRFLDGETIITPQNGDEGVDLYLSTSSAGGGLQMMVTGVVKAMTGESAERAALGAGAIVMDTVASNDGRLPHEKIRLIRNLRPDMILLSGGVDGGTKTHVVELAQLIGAAAPKARLGAGYELPVIFAGNQDARGDVEEELGDKTALSVVDNIRPTMELENLMPARHAIHDLFMEHVMAHAPGYKTLMSWTDAPIMPTPAAVGSIIQKVAEQRDISVIGVDIGGATTDVFSVFQDTFNRTVSANLGMSYSISNVLAEAGIDNVIRWVPIDDVDEAELRNRIKNKMIRPTTIPQALSELMIEQAIAREALRLAFEQHKNLAVGLKGVQQERTISDTFEQSSTGATLINLLDLDLLVGSGGVLSHAPRRRQSAAMLLDAFLPEGFTTLAVDSIFMMPQLGVLAPIHGEAATQVFERDCLIILGPSVAPIGNAKPGEKVMDVTLDVEGGEAIRETITHGQLKLIPFGLEQSGRLTVEPTKKFDMGAGRGKPASRLVKGGVVGLILDGRGRRPFTIPTAPADRIGKLQEWYAALDLYPARDAVAAQAAHA